MRRISLALAILLAFTALADAGWIFHRKKKEEVPGGQPNLVAPNGVEVPAWASKRMRESTVPLFGVPWGRRPWAMPLSTQATPSAVWARADQLGFGPGPVSDWSTSIGAAGNAPSAPVGPDQPGQLWGQRAGSRNSIFPWYPFNMTVGGF